MAKSVPSEKEALWRIRRIGRYTYILGGLRYSGGFLLATGIVWAVLDPSSLGAAILVLPLGAVTLFAAWEHWLLKRESRRLKERTGCPTLTEYEAFYMMKIFLARSYKKRGENPIAVLEDVRKQPVDTDNESAVWKQWRSTISAHSTPILAVYRPGVSRAMLQLILDKSIMVALPGGCMYAAGITWAALGPPGSSGIGPAIMIVLGGIWLTSGIYSYRTLKRNLVRVLNQTDYPTLTDHEAFDAMRYFLTTYRERSNGDLVALIEDTRPQPIDVISNSAAWQDWLLSVEQVKKRAGSSRGGCP